MGIIIALIIFSIIIMVHEFGHFVCAKLSGIRVNEFSIGMGPKLLQKRGGETLYTLRLIPAGGYCAMAGEDDSSEDERSFPKAKIWKRIIVLLAGAFMNFVLGAVLLVGMVSMMDTIPTTRVTGFSIDMHEDGTYDFVSSSMEKLERQDVIISIDGTRVFSILDLNYALETAGSGEHTVVVKRGGKRVTLEGVVFHNSKTGGIVDFGVEYREKSVLTVLKGSGDIFMSMTHIVGLSLKQLVSGKVSTEEVSGPVGVVSEISKTASESESFLDGLFSLLYMASLITINVGIFNLLPIPGLDGGRLLFCLIELVRGKPVKPEHEGYVHLAGMVLLFGLMIFATYNDIMRLITGG